MIIVRCRSDNHYGSVSVCFGPYDREGGHTTLIKIIDHKKIRIMTYYSRKIQGSFQEIMTRLSEVLSQHGFGIVSTIDLREKLRNKLDIEFRNYAILGVCNPALAYKAVSLESHIGVLLPCSILVQEHENGEVEVSAMNPLSNAGPEFATTPIKTIAQEVERNLYATIDSLDHPVDNESPQYFESTGVRM